MEKVMGRWQYAVILFGSVIGGTLFTFAAEGNTVAVGLSGGLYGLMAGYTYRILAAGGLKNPYVRNALIRTYLINIMINFMPGIAVSAHLGGFITGLILTAVLSEARHTKPFKVHFAISGCIYLFFLFFFVTRGFYIPDNQRFLGTDLAVLKMEKQAGLVNHAENMAKRLDLIYDINGSLENMLKED
jgi:hypothetical protein